MSRKRWTRTKTSMLDRWALCGSGSLSGIHLTSALHQRRQGAMAHPSCRSRGEGNVPTCWHSAHVCWLKNYSGNIMAGISRSGEATMGWCAHAEGCLWAGSSSMSEGKEALGTGVNKKWYCHILNLERIRKNFENIFHTYFGEWEVGLVGVKETGEASQGYWSQRESWAPVQQPSRMNGTCSDRP